MQSSCEQSVYDQYHRVSLIISDASIDLASSKQHRHKTYRAKASLSFNNAVRDLHLPAQGWKPHNQFNRINIMSNDNKLSLVLQKFIHSVNNIVCCHEIVGYLDYTK